MNKTSKLNKTDIEYLTHVWNFYPGCKHDAEVCPCAKDCWARGMAHRFKRSFEPCLIPDKLLEPLGRREPARIGVNFTGDLFGHWVDPDEWIDTQLIPPNNSGSLPQQKLMDIVKTVMRWSPQHQYYFLTKRPANIIAWGQWPDNAYMGATVCNRSMMIKALAYLGAVKAKHKWLSIEPLMENVFKDEDADYLVSAVINWIVIGGWSGGHNSPRIEWVKEIETVADKAGIPVFEKNNLYKLLGALRKDLEQ